MTNSPLDCVKAVRLKNQSAKLTSDEKVLLQSHLENCLECRELQISCNDALDLIDNLSVVSASTNNRLTFHINKCPECRAASILEPSFRTAIAPAILPTPSLSFEARLASKLSFTPAPARLPAITVQANKVDRVSQWSWAVAAVTLAAVLAAQFPKAYTLYANIQDLSLKALAYIASHLTGEVAVAYSLVKHSSNYFTQGNINLSMIVVLLAVTLITASQVILRDD